MGGTYRTPSPQRGTYISSSVENTPHSAPAVCYDSHMSLKEITRPSTPDPKPSIAKWYGLPSPQTPSFDKDIAQTSAIVNQSPTQVWRRDHSTTSFQSVEEDSACFTADSVEEVTPKQPFDITLVENELKDDTEALSTATWVRRSHRVSTKIRDTISSKVDLPPIKPNRTASKPGAYGKKHGATELSIVPFKADPVPIEGLPVLQSLEWQLQYPPGGSTHPSYPYPAPDPRLLFHSNLVPVTDGLPDSTILPKLLLPVGWRQVSWCGLLPIVFDPYRQAFKLTPVGPLPLTSEELHQNGLHKYVPGGELHPETALLPDMTVLSDGSVEEVYDWPGVSWTLPWAEQGHFDGPSPLASMTSVESDRRNMLSTMSLVNTPTTVVHLRIWREARDCLDSVFDIEDGWRWLAGKEQNPGADFVPTSKKQWHGSGAYRSGRVIKSPLPELMMLSKLGDPEDTRFVLQNQDAREPRKKNHFCPFKSVATPVYADITLLADTEFTLMELLCYFPHHFHWGNAAERYTRAGLHPSTVRDMIHMTRELDSDTSASLSLSAIKGGMTTAKKRDLLKSEGSEETADVTISYTAEGWRYDVWEKINYPLLALAHGLKELPQGADAGPLTTLIQYCRQNARYEVLLDDVPALLKEVGIEPLIEPGDAGCPDQEFGTRHAEALKMDRRRLKENLKMSSRDLENDDVVLSRRKRVRLS